MTNFPYLITDGNLKCDIFTHNMLGKCNETISKIIVINKSMCQYP